MEKVFAKIDFDESGEIDQVIMIYMTVIIRCHCHTWWVVGGGREWLSGER